MPLTLDTSGSINMKTEFTCESRQEESVFGQVKGVTFYENWLHEMNRGISIEFCYLCYFVGVDDTQL